MHSGSQPPIIMSPTRHLCIAKDLSAVKRPLIGRGSEGNDISSRNLAPFLGCAQKAEFCNADETETRAASREQRLPRAVSGRLSEATVVVVAVEERMAKVKPASGVQWPQKETLYAAATGCPACEVFEQI